jgi:hypothetical protein
MGIREHFDIGHGYHGTNLKALAGILENGARAGGGVYGSGFYVAHDRAGTTYDKGGTTGQLSAGVHAEYGIYHPPDDFTDDEGHSPPVIAKGTTGIKNPKVVTRDEWTAGLQAHVDELNEKGVPNEGVYSQASMDSYNATLVAQGHDSIHIPTNGAGQGISLMLHPEQFRPEKFKELEIPDRYREIEDPDYYHDPKISSTPWSQLT